MLVQSLGQCSRCIRAGTGKVLSFYVNSTQANHNPSRKKQTIPQDYFTSLILCSKRGAVRCDLTNRALWTNYNFPLKTSVYNVKRQLRAMRCAAAAGRCDAGAYALPVPVPGDLVTTCQCRVTQCQVPVPMPAMRCDPGRAGAGEMQSNDYFKRTFQTDDTMQVDDGKRTFQAYVSSG